ncbi:MAG: response regulator transcription factor [Anaerolineales bacterium]|nr:response regulator transcription factor [Anaerolineales bacterium]
MKLNLLLVEDNEQLCRALQVGLEATEQVKIVGQVAMGEDAVTLGLSLSPDVVLMDVALAGEINGIQAAVLIRREHPRMPIVFYSIQDKDEYYRDFLNSGFLSHYAYVRKSNYLLPASILPLLQNTYAGQSFIDPEIETRVQEVRHKDKYDPIDLLEPNEIEVVSLLANGMTNEQIAARLGLRDKRAVSRTNGQIYTAWGLNETPTDEKVARTRAAIIFHQRRIIVWNDKGLPLAANPRGEWIPLEDEEQTKP